MVVVIINTVPVRLRRAQNDEHGKHEDGHFATATIRYMKDLASIFGNDCVFIYHKMINVKFHLVYQQLVFKHQC